MKFNIETLNTMEQQSLLDVAANGAFRTLLTEQINDSKMDVFKLDSSSASFRADYAGLMGEIETLTHLKRTLVDVYEKFANPQIEE